MTMHVTSIGTRHASMAREWFLGWFPQVADFRQLSPGGHTASIPHGWEFLAVPVLHGVGDSYSGSLRNADSPTKIECGCG